MPTSVEPPGAMDIVRALRRRRRLRAGRVQAAYLIAALILALVTPRIHFGPTADAAQVTALLQALGGGLITFIALIFSLLFLVLQHASTALSPRLLLFRDLPLVWHAMGLFAGVFVYATVASLAAARSERVSVIVPGLAILLVLVCLAVSRALQLKAFAAVQLGPVLGEVTSRGLAVISELYPRRDGAREVEPLALVDPGRQVFWPWQHAVVRQIDLPGTLALLKGTDCVVVVHAAVGRFLTMGRPVMTIHGTAPQATDEQLLSLLEVGTDRTFEQDPLLGFRLLNDIALRALSPAVNDPATAVQAVAGIEDLLFALLDRKLRVGKVHDATGRLRVVLDMPAWEEYVRAGLESAPYAANSPTVQSRLIAMLDRLVAAAPPDRVGPLLEAREALRYPPPRGGQSPPAGDDRGQAG